MTKTNHGTKVCRENYDHVRPCGVPKDRQGNVADDMCLCGCTAYEEGCQPGDGGWKE